MKKLTLQFLICAIFFCALPCYAQNLSISNGILWLSANQNTDGSWGVQPDLSVVNTTDAVNALLISSGVGSNSTSGITWLSSQNVISTDELSRTIISLVSAGTPSASFVTTLTAYRNTDGGWGYELGNASDPLDTALALQTLKVANYSETTLIGQSLNYLTANQNIDGGWGFYPSTGSGQALTDPSNAYVTAITLRTLAAFSSQFSVQSSIDKAKAYLLTKQNADGGFGSSPSNVYETALSFMALIQSGQGSTQTLQNAINYLTTTQLADGSWNDDPYSTALALQALAAARPNLTVSSITLSKPMPQEGETITITANVNNTGLDNASNIIVRFFLGDPSAGSGQVPAGGIQIGIDQVIPTLIVGGSAQTSITASFTGTGGKTIFVVVDPDNLISETSKADNKASTRLWVATGPDLAVFSEDLKPSTFVPTPGTAFTLAYTVRNLGEGTTGAFYVAVYDGNPLSGGTILQTEHISGLNGTEVRTGTIGITLTTNGPHTLYLVADTGSAIQEVLETNNTGSVTVNVGGSLTQADLAINAADLILVPSRPHADDTVLIAALVKNQGADNADNFSVEFYDGAPDAGGVLINTQTVSLVAGGEKSLTAQWSIPEGTHDVYVVIDRMNAIVESDESNNSTSVRVMTDMVDIALSATDLVIGPGHPVSGDAVALTITAHNTGIRDTGAFNLALYDGDPNAGGALLQTYPISNISGDGSTTVSYPFTAVPWIYRFYVIADAENAVVELYEDNNQAIRSLKVKAPGEILGPDLVPVKIDLSDTTTDPQTLAISGTAHVTLQNKGDDKITTAFNVLVFEDKDNDGRYTAGVDNLIGTGTNSLALWPEGANLVDVALSGTVQFLHAPLYAFVDSGDSILEQDETNNLLASCKDCQVAPANPIEPVVKWRKTGMRINSQPVIAPLIDTNGDGKIDDKDIPAILFTEGIPYGDGKLWALRGDTGAVIFTYYNSSHRIAQGGAQIAVSDINGDGFPEIVVPRDSDPSGLLVFDYNGNLKWDNAVAVAAWDSSHAYEEYATICSACPPVLADLDHNGTPEIIVGSTVFNSSDGSIRWARRISGDSVSYYPATVADLDLDGIQDIIYGKKAYDSNGTLKWRNASLYSGYNAVGKLGSDSPYPEIVLESRPVNLPILQLLDHDGKVKWGPVYIKNLDPGGPWSSQVAFPIIADFDGDGEPEIGVSGYNKYFALDKNGNLKHAYSIPGDKAFDPSSAATVFDLNGDGRPEVLINISRYFRIFDGESGALLYEEAGDLATGAYGIQNVIIADVDGNGRSEAVVVGRDGIRIYESKNQYWAGSRKIYNQFDYHVTNVNDDGSIPQYESPSWLLNNTFRTQAAVSASTNPYVTPNLTASYLRAEQNGLSVDIAVRIGNGGAVQAPVGAAVTFYDGDPSLNIVIGTAATTRALQPGEYQDLTFSASGLSVGVHHVYAVVNGCSSGSNCSNRISECNYDDNQTTIDFTVENGYADLKIGPEDITLPLAPYYEGSIIPVMVNVKNIGAIPASNVSAKLYNGSPAAGGVQVGTTQTLSSIDAGGSTNLIFSFDTLGKTGTNVLYIVLDQENSVIESNETNNVALVSIDVQTSVMPNLAITADGIAIMPSSVQEGQQVQVTAAITNRGAAVGNIPVRIYLGDPAAGGIVISEQMIYPILSLGQTATVQTTFDSAGLSGQQTVFVTIDPLNTIVESSKDDNSASKSLFIQSAGLSSSLALDKTAYQPNETVTATITVTNSLTLSRNLNLNLAVTDSAGNLIATVASAVPLTADPGSPSTIMKTWNTGAALAGNYSITTELAEGGTVVSRANAGFTIAADRNIAASVTVDKVSYKPNETAALTSTITSRSANYIQENLSAKMTIGSSSSSGQVYTETKTIATLMPGASYTFKSYWNTGTFAPGTYPVLLEVRDATGAVVATGAQNLVIASTVDPSALLKGQIAVDRQVLLAGETVAINYSVMNVGNTDLPDVSLAIKTVSVDEKTVYDTLTDHAGLAKGGSYANARELDTAQYGAKDYLVVLRANISGTEETLSGTYFRVEGSPTEPSLNSPENGSDVEAFTPVLTVNNASDPNDDKITYEFELYADPGLTLLEASSGRLAPGAGVTGWTVPFMLTENRVYSWRARAFDGWLYGPWMAPASFRVNIVNDPPTAPVPTSPVDNGIVSTLLPALTIDNASDPDSLDLTYNFDLALDPDFTQLIASEKGVFAGPGMTSWQVPASLAENVTYYWRAQADDWLITGPWSATSRFFVNTVNNAPTAPAVTVPANNAEITALAADIAVQNSTDPDSYVITYFFEADTAMTFDSSGAVRSESVPQGQGTDPSTGSGQANTIWHMGGLRDNTIYYVRAKASDGQAESPWSAVISFFVNTANDPPGAPVVVNPSNGAGVNVFTPTLSVQNAVDLDNDVLTYEFALYADAGMTTLVASASNIAETPGVTAWTVPAALTENQNYYWRARAFDGELTGAWTPPASFMVNTANDAPGAPALSSPADGASVSTLSPALTIINAVDPDRDRLVYDFEVTREGALVSGVSGAAEGGAGTTSVTLSALADNTAYQWRARAFDGDRYGPWMTMAGFTVHVPRTGIDATIDFDPDTLNKTSNGTWVVVYIELPAGYRPVDIDILSIRLGDAVPAETRPYAVGDHDKDGIADLMVKFRRSEVISVLPGGEHVPVHVSGKVGSTTFDGVDVIRVIP